MSKAMVLNEMWARCPPSVMKSQLDNTAIFMNQAQAIRTLGELNLVTISSLVIFVNLARVNKIHTVSVDLHKVSNSKYILQVYGTLLVSVNASI